MSITCPHSRLWLHNTLNHWVRTSCRSASTTSAINRGLRATREADHGNDRESGRGKDGFRHAQSRQGKPRRDKLIRKFESGDPRPPHVRLVSKHKEEYTVSVERKTSPQPEGRLWDQNVKTEQPTKGAVRIRNGVSSVDKIKNNGRTKEYTGRNEENVDRTKNGVGGNQARERILERRGRAVENPAARSRREKESSTRSGEEEAGPLSIPYTTAASIFIYGTNTVLASLRAQRRRFYKLYLNPRFSEENLVNIVKNLARKHSLPINEHTPLKLLDRMSQDRPHNGIVLEASRLPAPPVLSIGAPDKARAIPLNLSQQSPEDRTVNGTPSSIRCTSQQGMNPLVVLLDGITDPGNVGAILRTLYFYGVSAAAIATNTCAPLDSATLAKASSGACEVLPILALPRPSAFVHEASRAGWKIFAAVAPNDPVARAAPSSRKSNVSTERMGKILTTSQLPGLNALARAPCILMLGAEGEGLRANLKQRADHFVTIEGALRSARGGGNGVDVGVDSLNVSAAASVLVEAFMRKVERPKRFEGGKRRLSEAENEPSATANANEGVTVDETSAAKVELAVNG